MNNIDYMITMAPQSGVYWAANDHSVPEVDVLKVNIGQA